MSKKVSAQSKNYSIKQGTKISLPWRTAYIDSQEGWNAVCAWVIEQYGMPGERYEWHATEDTMDFIFSDERDAVHCMLRWS